MEHLTGAVRQAVAQNNPYAALLVALTLPDICAALSAANGKTCGARYAAWFDRYVRPAYTRTVSGRTHVFLGGADCYALRCALLHEGLDDTSGQRAKAALDSFAFVQPTSRGTVIHCNQSGKRLNLQVDVFCGDMCSGVEAWLLDVADQPETVQRIAELMTIDDLSRGWST